MELQALRYALMVANMKFEEAVKTYENHLLKTKYTVANAEGELADLEKQIFN